MDQHATDLAYLVNYLQEERGMGASAVEPRSDSVWFDRTWERFRALVNTREPLPAPPEFLAVQDRFLQGLIAQAGITDAATLPPCPPTHGSRSGAATSPAWPQTPS